jgi:hypothetical protein
MRANNLNFYWFLYILARAVVFCFIVNVDNLVFPSSVLIARVLKVLEESIVGLVLMWRLLLFKLHHTCIAGPLTTLLTFKCTIYNGDSLLILISSTYLKLFSWVCMSTN